MTLFAGLPGSGKSTFAEWLSREKNYFYVDMERGGLDTLEIREIWNQFEDGSNESAFLNYLRDQKKDIVLDWNFPPQSLDLVQRLKENGIEVWWFDGDRLSARKRFLERNTEPVANFDAHVGAFCCSWSLIAPIIGENIIRNINPDASFTPAEETWHLFNNNSPHGF
ncbi:MAG: hypothetical protein ABL880_04110 [Methylotenera sp.]